MIFSYNCEYDWLREGLLRVLPSNFTGFTILLTHFYRRFQRQQHWFIVVHLRVIARSHAGIRIQSDQKRQRPFWPKTYNESQTSRCLVSAPCFCKRNQNRPNFRWPERRNDRFSRSVTDLVQILRTFCKFPVRYQLIFSNLQTSPYTEGVFHHSKPKL